MSLIVEVKSVGSVRFSLCLFVRVYSELFVKVENVKRFVIYVSPKMGDVKKPFAVDFGDGRAVTAIAEPVSGDIDYTAKLEVVAP